MVRVPHHDPEHGGSIFLTTLSLSMGRRVRVAVRPIRRAHGPEALEGQAHRPEEDRGEDRPRGARCRAGIGPRCVVWSQLIQEPSSPFGSRQCRALPENRGRFGTTGRYWVLLAKIVPGGGLFPGRGKECDFWWDSYFKIVTARPPDVQICSNLPVYVLFVIEVPKCAKTTTRNCDEC